MDGNETPRLDEIQAALDEGDVDRARRTLLDVEGRERELLVEELGEEAFARARGAASRGGRRGKLGRVLVLPGIMGSELDSVDAKGEADRIWLNYARLIFGRIGDLELAPDGSPKMPGLHVRLAGVHRKTYLAMILELDTRWHVRPFPFDWREDIDKSADRLAGEVQAFGGGDPVHLVAHSMGGLVSRRFIQRHREVWQSMHDPSGQGRGGRLVMLGTPNRGSFAIPLTLTGAEKLVKLLDKADIRHSREALLSIIGTFPGLYQMLPSPLVDLDDDHARLFEAPTWGSGAVRAALLTKAQELIRDLHDVIDRERLLYVAGYEQLTPSKIRIRARGKFDYLETYDGDGRVPHALGLLDGVDTYWVREIHGDLPKNARVLDAITELLQNGTTARLEPTKPARPPATRAARPRWVRDSEIEPVEPEIDAILTGSRARGASDDPALTPEEEIRLENLGFAEYLGTGGAKRAGTSDGDGGGPGGAEPGSERPPPVIRVEVLWGDVTRADGDVYAVGHYEGVEPQRAELALDQAVSGVEPGEPADPRRLVITQHARRGMLRGALGDVSFFPWGREDDRGRTVAVAGMGRPGAFDRRALRQLVRSLILAIGALPRAQTICSVLIGSGEGTLTVAEAVRGLVEGIGEAVEEIEGSEDLRFAAPVTTLRIVERERGRAEEIQAELMARARTHREMVAAGHRPPVNIDLKRRVTTGREGTVSVEESIALLAESALQLAAESRGPQARRTLEALLSRNPASKTVQKLTLTQLHEEGKRLAEEPGRRRFRVSLAAETGAPDIAVRVSYWVDGAAIRVAAIHSAATVPERLVKVGGDVVDDLVERMTDPRADDVEDLCRLLYRLLVPTPFRDVLSSGPLVLEVDRPMARVHWEMLSGPTRRDGRQPPLAVSIPLARQIRTQYSPSPLPARRPREKLRALVIGDPGDPAKGEDLPGARREALRVVDLLTPKLEVEARIGAPSVPRDGALRDIRPADRLEVLGLLLEGGFDILHYAGHGDFDPDDPSRAGWLFERGLLTAGEIERMDHVPSIVMANACLSARTSQALAGQRRAGNGVSEAGLLPSLADEFFRLGVRDYVGTAWEVNDIGAELFAQVFYETLLPGNGGPGDSFGEAIRKARRTLWDRRDDFGALWAAYQHYGDPTIHAGIAAGP